MDRSIRPTNPRPRPQAPPTGQSIGGLQPPPLGDAARDTAIRALARQTRAFPALIPDAFDQQLQAEARLGAAPLKPLDAALAHAIYTAAVQRWLTITYLLHREIRQGFEALEPRAQATLLAGAAQVLFLDRVPAHAAINHAVEWAKQAIRPGAGGLVNAVLRKIADLRAGAAIEPGPWNDRPDALPLGSGLVLRHAALALPTDPLDRLSIATSHPRQLLACWSARMPPEQVRDLALHTLVEPPIVLNTEHAGPLSESLLAASTPHADGGHRVYTGPSSTLGDLLAASPGVWVQDASAAGAVRSIGDLRPTPGLIVDLCAGQGTKTRQLAAAFPDAAIIATDVDAHRLGILRSAFEGSKHVTVLPIGPARAQALAQADLVLLDVPCSNTGVLPRRPEARYRFSTESLESLEAVQRQIVADTIPLLRTGRHRGSILYSTCSLEPRENDAVGAWAARWHQFRPQRQRLVAPAGGPGDPPTSYRDGAFSVLLTPP